MPTTFMSLQLPTVSVTIGPQWATEINAALTSIDSHDHSTNQGTKITPAGLNINSELSLGNQKLSNIGKATYQNLTALDVDNITTYFKDGDFYINDNAGNKIRVTSGGALNVGSVGGIGGDYTSTAATIFYTDASKTYFFQDSTSSPSILDIGDLNTQAVSATSVTSTGVVSASAFVGPGALPLGAIIPIASNLSGAMAIPATGTVNSDGFQYCDGAAIAGAATMSGTIYDLTDERFLLGSTVSGTLGGSNSVTPTLSGTQSIAHTHTGPSHQHDMRHVHQSIHNTSSGRTSYALTTRQDTLTSFTNSTTGAATFRAPSLNASSSSSNVFSVTTATTGAFYTAGAVNAAGASVISTGAGGTQQTLGMSANSSVDFSNATVSSIDNKPKYISVVYVMRVK